MKDGERCKMQRKSINSLKTEFHAFRIADGLSQWRSKERNSDDSATSESCEFQHIFIINH